MIRGYGYGASGSGGGGGTTAPNFVSSASQPFTLPSVGDATNHLSPTAVATVFYTQQSGNKWVYCYYRITQTVADGTATSGDFLFPYPTGIALDTSIVPADNAAYANPFRAFGSPATLESQFNLSIQTDDYTYTGQAVAYSSTQFRLLVTQRAPANNTNPMVLNGAGFGMNNTFILTGWIRIPIP